MAGKWWEKITPWNDRDLSRRLKKSNIGRALGGLAGGGRGRFNPSGVAGGIRRGIEGLTPWNDQDLRNRFRKARIGARGFTDKMTPWNDQWLRSSMRRNPWGRSLLGEGGPQGPRNQMGAEQPGYGGPRGKSRYMNRGFYEDGGHVKPESTPQEAPAESSSVGTPTTVYQSHNSSYEEGK